MADDKGTFLNRIFELRSIVAVLFGVFGIVCVIWGLGFTGPEELKKAAGINVNLLSGIGMLIFAAVFAAWAILKPIEEEQREAEQEGSEAAS